MFSNREYNKITPTKKGGKTKKWKINLNAIG